MFSKSLKFQNRKCLKIAIAVNTYGTICRIYKYMGSESIKLAHTMYYRGVGSDQNVDGQNVIFNVFGSAKTADFEVL